MLLVPSALIDTFACLFEFEVFAVIITDSKTAEGVLL